MLRRPGSPASPSTTHHGKEHIRIVFARLLQLLRRFKSPAAAAAPGAGADRSKKKMKGRTCTWTGDMPEGGMVLCCCCSGFRAPPTICSCALWSDCWPLPQFVSTRHPPPPPLSSSFFGSSEDDMARAAKVEEGGARTGRVAPLRAPLPFFPNISLPLSGKSCLLVCACRVAVALVACLRNNDFGHRPMSDRCARNLPPRDPERSARSARGWRSPRGRRPQRDRGRR
jgi:hypothetical protein